MDWKHDNPFEAENSSDNPGYLVTEDTPYVSTVGATMAYGKDYSRRDVDYKLSHSSLHKEHRHCASSDGDGDGENDPSGCLHILGERDGAGAGRYWALRGRSITSAGMHWLGLSKKERDEYRNLQDDLWETTAATFGIDRRATARMRHFIQSDRDRILREAFEGQCTPMEGTCDSTSKKNRDALEADLARKARTGGKDIGRRTAAN